MSIKNVILREPGKEVCLMGNEAFARGAVEAGVDFISSYPGSPSSEISGTLFKCAKEFGHYGEWSVNEKVGLEAAGAASLAGLRSMSVMKHNGINVCLDFLLPFTQQGCEGGFVVIVCDDPNAHSSTNETDSRFLGRMGEIPMLEPSNFQEAKDLTKYAFELSEELKVPVLIRGVTRLSHARGNVVLGEIPVRERKAEFSGKKYITDKTHYKIKIKDQAVKERFDASDLNIYRGPEGASKLVICTGVSYPYAVEAIERFDLADKVGILKITTDFPLPEKTILGRLAAAEEVLFLEEIEPYMEEQVKALAAQELLGKGIRFHGKADGTVKGCDYPGVGEMTPDIAFTAVTSVFTPETPYKVPDALTTDLSLPVRELTFCAGCPHRASYWSLQHALKKDGRGGFALGDIGCYGLEALRESQDYMRTLHCMGGGMGMGNGFGQMSRFGMDKPVVPVVGDSTFFHSCVSGLLNAKYNGAKMTVLVLDNTATAMTGFQPHPGTGKNAVGDIAPKIEVEDVCRGIGVPVYSADPYNVKETQAVIEKAIAEDTANVVVLHRQCALLASKGRKKPRVTVDTDKCLGEKCGICSRKFGCPGNIWDKEKGKAAIDDVLCMGCGVCATLCPAKAIKVEEVEE